jgi:glyoxylase-like metal-dependent hydrolase (beta-lactamase superfamily II)
MIHVQGFTVNSFSQNTYIVYDDNKNCFIIDPGCSTKSEENLLTSFIEKNELKPLQILLTHAHIDHILGNYFMAKKYNLSIGMHLTDLPLLQHSTQVAQMYGINYLPSPDATIFYDDGDEITLGSEKLKVLFTPGHSPGSITFYNEKNKFAIVGDVLFQNSIGRTDLPGGDFDTLAESIKSKLYVLPSETIVYSGHGDATTIGQEKLFNPFVRE